jgi:hypothetical protein
VSVIVIAVVFEKVAGVHGVPVGVGVGVGDGVGVGVGDGLGVGDGDGVTQVPIVVIVMLQPPAMLPASPAPSSDTYKLHVPFGAVALNTESAAPPAGAGAGAGKVSPAPVFVGLNVPLANGPASGREVAAASSSVNVTFDAAVEPPTSDMIIAFWPPGPTSKMSMSSGKI